MMRFMVCEPGGRVIVQTSDLEMALLQEPRNGRFILHEETQWHPSKFSPNWPDPEDVECDLMYLADGERWQT